MLTTLSRRTDSRTKRGEHLRARRRAPGAAHPEDALYDDSAGVTRKTPRDLAPPHAPTTRSPRSANLRLCATQAPPSVCPVVFHHPGSDPILTSCHGHID